MDDGNKVQAFVVEKGSQGLIADKMKGKMSLRGVQNAELTMNGVFVPDRNKLAKAKDFGSSTAKVLETSRVLVAWAAVGLAAGAYESALAYCLKRVQFGKPIAGF